MPSFRKLPVEVEAWPVRTLNLHAQHDWYALPKVVRDDYENPQGEGAWVFGALKENNVCTTDSSHGPHDIKASYCWECGAPLVKEGRRGICVPTLEGNLFADPGDWIIRGVKGEFYPCKPDIFEKTYEEVSSPSAA